MGMALSGTRLLGLLHNSSKLIAMHTCTAIKIAFTAPQGVAGQDRAIVMIKQQNPPWITNWKSSSSFTYL